MTIALLVTSYGIAFMRLRARLTLNGTIEDLPMLFPRYLTLNHTKNFLFYWINFSVHDNCLFAFPFGKNIVFNSFFLEYIMCGFQKNVYFSILNQCIKTTLNGVLMQ